MSFENASDESVVQDVAKQTVSTLIARNITINNHRTSIRLEPEMWYALVDISRRERLTIHKICSVIADEKSEGTSLTAAVRVFIMVYFRTAATEDGHLKAGHGQHSSAVSFSSRQRSTMQSPKITKDLLIQGGQETAEIFGLAIKKNSTSRIGG